MFFFSFYGRAKFLLKGKIIKSILFGYTLNEQGGGAGQFCRSKKVRAKCMIRAHFSSEK